jgi:hypothetical protein
MSTEEYKVEVVVVPRPYLDDPEGYRETGIVSRAFMVGEEKYLTVVFTEPSHHMADICLSSNWVITHIWWQNDSDSIADGLAFSHGDESQNEAFEYLLELMSEEQEEEEPEEMSTGLDKRMEVTLEELAKPGQRKTVLAVNITSYVTQPMWFTLHGREWSDGRKTLGAFIEGRGWSDKLWSIVSITEYGPGKGQSFRNFGTLNAQQQRDAWEKVADYCEGLTPYQARQLKEWEPAVDEEDEEEAYLFGFGGSHYTQKVPQHYQKKGAPTSSYTPYKPPVAMYRVCGDELGAVLHLDTCEAEVARDEEEREMSIQEYLEKKDGAGAGDEEAEASAEDTSETSTDSSDKHEGVSGNSRGSGTICPHCLSPLCTTCEDDLDGMAAAALHHGVWMH